jgi:hypothetical protein
MSETGSMGLSSSSIAGEKVVRSRLFSSAKLFTINKCNRSLQQEEQQVDGNMHALGIACKTTVHPF